MGHFARECRAPKSQDRGKRESYRKDPKVEEPAPKALMALDGIGATWLMKMKTMHLWQMILFLLPQVYSPPQRDLSWTGLPEFVDDTVTDYTRPTPSVDVSKDVRSDLDGNNTSIFKQGETSGSNMSG
ncbi:hypothetical protein Tco_0344026 [Tanacetum coccineum]